MLLVWTEALCKEGTLIMGWTLCENCILFEEHSCESCESKDICFQSVRGCYGGISFEEEKK
jgi:hypothetical protein